MPSIMPADYEKERQQAGSERSCLGVKQGKQQAISQVIIIDAGDYETTVGSDYDIVCETGEATDDHVGGGG